MKILYFTAGPVPTTEEKADIAALNAFAVAPFEVGVRNAVQVGASGSEVEAADYVAFVSGGSAPEPYDDDETYPVFDPAAPPASSLPAGVGLVADGQVFDVTGGTVEVTVTDGVVTMEFTPE